MSQPLPKEMEILFRKIHNAEATLEEIRDQLKRLYASPSTTASQEATAVPQQVAIPTTTRSILKPSSNLDIKNLREVHFDPNIEIRRTITQIERPGSSRPLYLIKVNRVKLNEAPEATDSLEAKPISIEEISPDDPVEEALLLPDWFDEPEDSTVKPQQQQELSVRPRVIRQAAIQFYSNNVQTITHGPNRQRMQLHINLGDGREKTVWVPKEFTGRELHSKIREAFEIPKFEGLNLVFVQHRVIEPDDTTMWNVGMRYIPNNIVRLPHKIDKGDLIEVKYSGLGPNVNGDPANIIPKHMRNNGPRYSPAEPATSRAIIPFNPPQPGGNTTYAGNQAYPGNPVNPNLYRYLPAQHRPGAFESRK